MNTDNYINNKFYAQQRQVIINRDTVAKGGKGKQFIVVYTDNLIDAMKRLSHTAFKVYLCLLFNKDQYSTEFSPEHISRIAGMCLDTARKAFKELLQCGYIEMLDNTHYLFFEVAHKKLTLKPHEERRVFTDSDTGEIHNLTYKELVSFVGDDALSMWQEAAVYEPKTEEE